MDLTQDAGAVQPWPPSVVRRMLRENARLKQMQVGRDRLVARPNRLQPVSTCLSRRVSTPGGRPVAQVGAMRRAKRRQRRFATHFG